MFTNLTEKGHQKDGSLLCKMPENNGDISQLSVLGRLLKTRMQS